MVRGMGGRNGETRPCQDQMTSKRYVGGKEEDQRGQVPRKNVSAGAIWRETIRRGEFCLCARSGLSAGNTVTRDARPYRRTLRNAGAEETTDAGAGCVRPG